MLQHYSKTYFKSFFTVNCRIVFWQISKHGTRRSQLILSLSCSAHNLILILTRSNNFKHLSRSCCNTRKVLFRYASEKCIFEWENSIFIRDLASSQSFRCGLRFSCWARNPVRTLRASFCSKSESGNSRIFLFTVLDSLRKSPPKPCLEVFFEKVINMKLIGIDEIYNFYVLSFLKFWCYHPQNSQNSGCS